MKGFLKRIGEWACILAMLVGVLFLLGQAQGNVVLLTGEISGGQTRPIRVDDSTHSIVAIDYTHHDLHAGDMYHVSYSATLGDAASAELRIVAPDTTAWGHMWVKVSGTFDTAYFLYETTTKTVGTGVATYNRNRNSPNTSGLTVTHTPGGAGDGNLLITERFGNDAGPSGMGGSSSSARSENEWEMKQNTVYLLRATSYTAANNVTINMDWYEHIDKD